MPAVTTPTRLGTRAAAEYIGVAYGTFRDWRLRGLLPFQAIKPNPSQRNGTVLFERKDLDAYLASRREAAAI